MIQLPTELAPPALWYPELQCAVAGLVLLAFAVTLSRVVLEYYLDYRHRQRMDAQRRWGEYQGGSIRAALQDDISPDTEDDCADADTGPACWGCGQCGECRRYAMLPAERERERRIERAERDS